MRGLAVLSCLVVLLAGCSDGGGDSGGSSSSVASSTSTSMAPPPPPVPTTDVLRFLEAPKMSTLPPPGSDVRTPVGFGGGGNNGPGQEGPTAEWKYQVTRPANVTGGEVHFWVEVKEQMFDTPGTPLREQCSWRLVTAIGGDTQPLINCSNEPTGVINPGIKELVFTLVFESSIELEANETLTLTLSRTGFSASANNAVDALSGSAEHDSRFLLRGLKEPIGA